MHVIKLNSFTIEITRAKLSKFKEQKLPDVIITYVGENGLKITFSPEYCLMDFDKCAQACRDGTNYSFDSLGCNGGAGVMVHGATVLFDLAKFGDGYGGSLTVRLPARDCVEMFEETHNAIESWIAQRKIALGE